MMEVEPRQSKDYSTHKCKANESCGKSVWFCKICGLFMGSDENEEGVRSNRWDNAY